MSQYDKLMKGRLLKSPNARDNPVLGHGGAWWAGMLVGLGLVVFPEPATTATGLLIVGSLALIGTGKGDKDKE
jgi:hypothetical protein